MPIDYSEYHPKWTLIVRLILKRDRHRCKFCGLKNGQVIMRTKKGPKFWRHLCGTEWDWFHGYRRKGWNYREAIKKVGATIIVLTIAHLDGNKDNNRFIKWSVKPIGLVQPMGCKRQSELALRKNVLANSIRRCFTDGTNKVAIRPEHILVPILLPQ